ncbi:hypothetical protein EUGRSUZ_F02541 [Eucalyptus grandis]|uniref:Uncharacterized protein n=2 Tax=Eucalyptus grandis TaxID=71139 RepID=A0ACC3KIN3_EUCGR|nr:hypothetical protein EUGRSUZ_F02541 [Eucalyptus grandis]
MRVQDIYLGDDHQLYIFVRLPWGQCVHVYSAATLDLAQGPHSHLVEVCIFTCDRSIRLIEAFTTRSELRRPCCED